MMHKTMRALKLAPLLFALAAVAAPAVARDHDRGRDRREYSRGHDRDHDRGRNDRHWSGDRRGAGDRGRWVDRDRDGRERHEHWNRPPPVVYHRPPTRVGYRPRPIAYRYGPAYHRAPSWVRGRDYRSYGYQNVYYVPYDHYARYRLYRPHYGYRWVRDDYGNFLLVAAATGIITSVLLNHAY